MKTFFLSLITAATFIFIAQADSISLPAPEQSGGRPLLDTLKARKSSRSFAPKTLSLKQLSNLLWAADGISRPDGRRTAPTGLNVQDTDIYVMLPTGVYRYIASAHSLETIQTGDHRSIAGAQSFPKTAPLNLFFVHNRDRAMSGSNQDIDQCAGIHTGAIMQNVYLYCASAGLSCVARRSFNAQALHAALKLSKSQSVILAQTIGFPQ